MHTQNLYVTFTRTRTTLAIILGKGYIKYALGPRAGHQTLFEPSISSNYNILSLIKFDFWDAMAIIKKQFFEAAVAQKKYHGWGPKPSAGCTF